MGSLHDDMMEDHANRMRRPSPESPPDDVEADTRCPDERTRAVVDMLWNQIEFESGKRRRGWDRQFLADEVAWVRSRPKAEDRTPKLTVISVLGQSQIEASDGEVKVCLNVTRQGVELLIEELQTVLEMADD